MSLTRAGLFLVALGLVAEGRAEPPRTPKKTEPIGVYVCKSKFGSWCVTYERGGFGRCEAKFIVEDKVHEEQFDFRWSLKGNEIIAERISDDPELWTVEHSHFLPNDTIRAMKGYRDGKLRWEAENDRPVAEFLGLEARPRERPAVKPDDQAKAAVQEYIKAVRAKNLDRALKVVEVPWLANGKRIVKDQPELAKWLKAKIDGVDNPADIPSEVLRVQTYGEARAGITDEGFRKLADQVLGKEDFVVDLGRRGVVYDSHFVKISGGKAKVVGYQN